MVKFFILYNSEHDLTMDAYWRMVLVALYAVTTVIYNIQVTVRIQCFGSSYYSNIIFNKLCDRGDRGSLVC